MKIFKKFCTIIAAGIMVCSLDASEVKSLFGNTHFNLGKKIIENLDISLSKNQKKAFLSGIVYADIGRFKFDKEIEIDSDSGQFIAEMKKHIYNSEEEWFAIGCEIHRLQDTKVGDVLKDIFENKENICYKEYVTQCALLDCYFLKKTNEYIHSYHIETLNFDQIKENLDKLNTIPLDLLNYMNLDKNIALDMLSVFYNSVEKKYHLNLYNNLLKKTYKELGLNLDDKSINEQAGNIVGSFAILTFFFKHHEILDKTEFISKTELACNKLVKECTNYLKTIIQAPKEEQIQKPAIQKGTAIN